MSNESQRVFITDKMAKLNITFPVKLPGLPFEFPINLPYGEFWIMGTKPFPAGGFGKGKIIERTIGVIQLTTWVPEGQGTKAAIVAIDLFGKAFKYKLGTDAEGCRYKFQGCEVIAPTIKSDWTCILARIPFQRDEIAEVEITT